MPATARESWRIHPIQDARGRTVQQLDPVTMHLARRHDVIPAEPLAEIAGEVGIGMTRANQVLFWSTIAGILCLGIAIVILLIRYFSGTISIGRLMRSLLPFCGVWLAPYGFWMGTRSARFTRITTTMLRRRFCPHCGYDMRGLIRDETDGATVCPECGCAWIIPEDSDALSG